MAGKVDLSRTPRPWVFVVRLSDDERQWLRELAEDRGVNDGALLRALLREAAEMPKKARR